MSTSNELITDAQIKKIWVELKLAGYDDKWLHTSIVTVCHKFSLKQLTKFEAAALIESLCTVNGTGKERRGMMTSRQQCYIDDLRHKLGWSEEELQCMVRRICKVDHIQFVDKTGASKLIEGLKNINSRKALEGEPQDDIDRNGTHGVCL